jgi:hypothetical protein
MKPQDNEHMEPPLRSWDRGKEGYYLASHGVFGPDWVAVQIETEDWDRVFDSEHSQRHGQPGVVRHWSLFRAPGLGWYGEAQARGYLNGFGTWHFIKREHYDRMRPEWLTHVRRVPCRP